MNELTTREKNRREKNEKKKKRPKPKFVLISGAGHHHHHRHRHRNRFHALVLINARSCIESNCDWKSIYFHFSFVKFVHFSPTLIAYDSPCPYMCQKVDWVWQSKSGGWPAVSADAAAVCVHVDFFFRRSSDQATPHLLFTCHSNYLFMFRFGCYETRNGRKWKIQISDLLLL